MILKLTSGGHFAEIERIDFEHDRQRALVSFETRGLRHRLLIEEIASIERSKPDDATDAG